MIIDDLFESPQLCPECGGISFSDLILAEKKDACYYKVKASAKVWPSAYASGRLVQCRKKGAGNYGNKSEGVAEGSLNELSKDTLKSYAKKAVPDMQASQNKSKAEYSKATSAKNDETANKHYDAAKQAKDRTEKRMAGISGAIKRVTKQGVAEMDKSQTPPGRDGSNDPDAGKKEYTAKATTPKKVAKHGEKILNKLMDKSYKQDKLDEKSTSQAQFRTMAAAAHNPEFARKVGISRDVAKEFHGADRKQDYADLPKKADESKSAPKEKEADYGDDYQAMVARVKKLAGLGPLKTVYDPQKRVYRNIPTAQQPKK